MNARISCLYDMLNSQAWKDMRKLGEWLTDDPQSVRVSGGPKPGMLTVDFTMKKEQQYKAVKKIEMSLWVAGMGICCEIDFPRTELEEARAARLRERARERRRLRNLAARNGELPSRPLRPKPAPPPPPKPAPRVHPSRRGPDVILYIDPLAPPEEPR